MRRRTTKKQLHPKSLDACVRAVVYPLGGVDCYLWFDEDGELHGTGPKEARRNLESFLLRYTPLMKSKKVIDCVSEHEPIEITETFGYKDCGPRPDARRQSAG